MIRALFRFLSLNFIFLFCVAAPAMAAATTYTGSPGDLKTAAFGGADGGAPPGSVFAGPDGSPLASGNNVTINYSSGTNPWRVFGGLSNSAAVTGNIVNFLDGTVNNSLYGGYDAASSSGYNAVDNRIFISGGTITTNALAGISLNGNASDNITTMTAGSVLNNLYGGSANGNGNAVNNQVIISGGQVGDGSGEATNGWVLGGYSNTGNALNNSVTISGSAVVNNVDTGESNSGLVSGNRLEITGGTILGIARGGWSETGQVLSNHIVMSGGTSVVHTLDGGVSNDSAQVSGNSVTITDGRVLNLVRGGYSNTGQVFDNHVFIFGGQVDHNVFGGSSTYSDVTGNSVNITGGNILGNVNGGQSTFGNTTHNIVNISGSANFGSGSTLRGGISISGDARTGNTLNLHIPITIADVENFQNWNFYLPSTMANGETMLTITGIAGLGSDAKVNVGIEGSSSPLKAGDTVKLIDASAGTLAGTLANTTANGQGMQGVTLKYEFDLLADTANGLLTATVSSTGPQVNEQAKALSEGFVSGAALANAGADFAAGSGMGWATGAAGQKGGGFGFGSFGGIGGGQSTYKTGSHVDMSSVSLLAGLAWGNDFAPGRLTLGAFFEYGNGSYDTYNSFSNAASVKGKGDMYNLGGGILGRFDANCGGYVESSFRAGGLHNEYKNGDLRDAMGRKAQYDSDSAYYGIHVGSGYIWNIMEKASLDLYTKYFWTRVGGDSVKLSTGDSVKFKDTDSHRLRGGARFAYAVNEFVSPYVGLAYEHEFDGKARATTNGFALPAPSMRGDTGIGELGLSLKPSQIVPLSFDLGMQGYVGKREGVTGSLQMKYEF